MRSAASGEVLDKALLCFHYQFESLCDGAAAGIS